MIYGKFNVFQNSYVAKVTELAPEVRNMWIGSFWAAKVEAKPCPTLNESELADVANWVGMGFSDDAIGDMYLSTTECAEEWRKAVER